MLDCPQLRFALQRGSETSLSRPAAHRARWIWAKGDASAGFQAPAPVWIPVFVDTRPGGRPRCR